MKTLKYLTVALLACLLAGCCACRKYQKKEGRPLVGTSWKMIQQEGRGVRSADGYTLRFEADGRFGGIGDCNRIMGQYNASPDGKITIRPAGSTRMACPDQAGENRYIEMLRGTTVYQLDGPMLYLFDNGELKAVFQAQDEKEK